MTHTTATLAALALALGCTTTTAQGATAEVRVAQTWFHTAPAAGTRGRAYLVRGDIFEIRDFQDGFFQGRFTGPRGVVTEGWIQASEVLPTADSRMVVEARSVRIYPDDAVTTGSVPHVVAGNTLGVLDWHDEWNLVWYAPSHTIGWVCDNPLTGVEAAYWETTARVRVRRAYFHDAPVANRRTSAFVIEGQTVRVSDYSDGYYFVTYTNPAQSTTEGWIARADLLPTATSHGVVAAPGRTLSATDPYTATTTYRLSTGQRVDVLLASGDALLVRVPDSGEVGWTLQDRQVLFTD